MSTSTQNSLQFDSPQSSVKLSSSDLQTAGNTKLLSELFVKYRDQLRRIVAARLDCRLRSRLDASDVIQDTLVEASRRIDEYLANPILPFDRWLSGLAEQNSVAAYRRHVQTQKRSLRTECPLDSSASSGGIASASRQRNPLEELLVREDRRLVADAMKRLNDSDRQIIHWRYFEDLRFAKIGKRLDISEDAATKRVRRAMLRLSRLLDH